MNQRLPNEFIQEVLSRTDIVEIIRTKVNLTHRGDNYLARCPFHEEKTPSFNVSQSKQFYYCFGCSAHGNAIGFLMAFDHFDFREAIDYLAGLAGLTIPTEPIDPEEANKQKILYQVLTDASQYYKNCLSHHPQAIEYLKSRGLNGVTAKNFSLGLAPAGWQGLQQSIGTKELNNALIEAGLCITKKDDQLYDRFRNRIIFPIRNIQGKIIGFGGRTMGDDQPKYLNSPETPLFHKGSELYGLYEARQHCPKLTKLVVVEGYMDVLALHQQGILYAAATLGTAITSKQVQKCLRYVNHCIFCFDGDRAGKQAAWKALIIALPLLREGVHIDFLFLPDTEDPDSLVRKIGGPAFSQLLEQSLPLPEVFFRELKAQFPLTTLADKAQFGQQAAQYLNQMPQGLFQQLMYNRLAEEIKMDPATLNKILQPTATAPKPSPIIKPLPALKTQNSKHQLRPLMHTAISLLLNQPKLAQLISGQREIAILAFAENSLFAKILGVLQQHPELTVGELLVRSEDTTEQRIISELAARTFELSPEELKAEFLGVINMLEQQAQKQNIEQLVEKAKKTELNLEEKRKLQTLLTKLKKDVDH